jgi:hypothetical protein
MGVGFYRQIGGTSLWMFRETGSFPILQLLAGYVRLKGSIAIKSKSPISEEGNGIAIAWENGIEVLKVVSGYFFDDSSGD